MKVLVMVAVSDDDHRDLQIVMVARLDGVLAQASPIVTLKGAEPSRTGNPYLVYGDAVEEFTGCPKFETSISVFDCRSGSLEGWL